MAKPGSTKWFSEQHENHVAKVYGGVRSPSSGAAVTDDGDVRTPYELFECKHRGTYDKPARSISVKLDDLEKIADEAWSHSLDPAMSLSIYCPDSILADADGHVYISARLESDDVRREWPNGY